jgi:Phosphotransferase enzyme family
VLGYGARRGRDYLLQRLNPTVFPDGGSVLRNLARVSTHLETALPKAGLSDPGRRVLRLIPTQTGEPGVVAPDGAWWRLLDFIPDTRMIETVEDPRAAREIGAAFGLVHRLLADYSGPPLETTMPDFHDTGQRVAAFENAVRRNPAGRVGAASPEIAFARSHSGLGELLAPALNSAPARVAHNDAKPSNVLLDAESGVGLAVVDLDTVMPGSVLHDVGDLVRSASHPANEDETDLDRVRVEPSLFLALASGFLSAGGPGVLTPMERELFVGAGMVITYEQGIRFLTDHLAGDRYYRISRPGQNLDRARVQFRLLSSIESMRADLEGTIADLTHSLWP